MQFVQEMQMHTHPSVCSEVHPKPSWNQVIFQLVLNSLRVQPEPEWASPGATWGSASIIWIEAGDRHQSSAVLGTELSDSTHWPHAHTERETWLSTKHALGEVIKQKNTLFKPQAEGFSFSIYWHARTGKRLCDQHVMPFTVCVAIKSYAELL